MSIQSVFGIERPNVVNSAITRLFGSKTIVYNVHVKDILKLTVDRDLQVIAVPPAHMNTIIVQHNDEVSGVMKYMIKQGLVR